MVASTNGNLVPCDHVISTSIALASGSLFNKLREKRTVIRSGFVRLCTYSFWITAAYGQIPSFQHVVVIVQENRTPDNLFQGLCQPFKPFVCSTTPSQNQYDIQTRDWLDNTSRNGVIQPGTVELTSPYDLSHKHPAFVAMCDLDASTGACRNDGAAGIVCTGTCPTQPQFRYVANTSGLLNPYIDLVQQYGWANYMFQTNQGPSFPAHQFLFGGTSAPSAADDAIGTFAAENMTSGSAVGCTAPAGTTVTLITAAGGENQTIYPCFEHETMPDLLTASLTWRYYAANATSIWTAPNAIAHICQSTGPGGQCASQDWADNVDLAPSDVLTDIANCKLRSLSWVTPTGANSDHADINDGGGPSWVASIVNAIGSSTACDSGGYWRDTAVLITWDDWGGWYDHEPPTILAQPEGDYQYGFRVPLIVVSAYTPSGYISNIRHDFGSLLRFIEGNFGLPVGGLNFADARSTTDLSEFFDLTKAPRSYRAISSPKTAAFFVADTRPATDPDDDQ
jgi:phospholipase C